MGTLGWIIAFVLSLSGECIVQTFIGYWYPLLLRLLYVVYVVQGGQGALGHAVGITCIAISAFITGLSYVGALIYFIAVAIAWRSGRASISPSPVIRAFFVALFLLGGWLVEVYGPLTRVVAETVL
jgi:hypothetical protein